MAAVGGRAGQTSERPCGACWGGLHGRRGVLGRWRDGVRRQPEVSEDSVYDRGVGFCCIPGSHKSHFKLPRQIHEAPEKACCVVIPDVPAGSVVLFSEAMMHGTAPWRADHERRTLLYKYCLSHMAWSRARVLPPPDVPLTPRQQALLTEPADPHTFVPPLFSDGPGAER